MKVTDTRESKTFAPSARVEDLRSGGTGRTRDEERVSTEESARVKAALAKASGAAAGGHAAKLQAIATAVKAGTYRPDPQRIARQILDEAELAARLQAIFGG